VSAVLAFACGLLAGWLARRVYVRWRNARLSRAQRIGDIVRRAP